MINRQQLLFDLQKLLQRLESDLLERSESAEVPDVQRTLRSEFERAQKAQRTAQNYEVWRIPRSAVIAKRGELHC